MRKSNKLRLKQFAHNLTADHIGYTVEKEEDMIAFCKLLNKKCVLSCEGWDCGIYGDGMCEHYERDSRHGQLVEVNGKVAKLYSDYCNNLEYKESKK